MKIATRYLLTQFTQPWLYVFTGFSIIIVLVNLFSTFGDFVDAGTSTGSILLFYLILLPTYLPYILPISLLLALLYALWNLGKNSEIIALRACGFSLTQITAPFLSIGLAATLILLVINETFNPWAVYWTNQFKEIQHRGAQDDFYVVRNLTFKNVIGHRLWTISSFNTRPSSGFTMHGITMIQQRPDGSDEFRLIADRARWMEGGHWWFGGVNIRYFDEHNNPVGPATETPYFDAAQISERPADFLGQIKNSANNERSAREILTFIRTHDISADARTRSLVDFHNRLASPWMCLIAVLLGIPFGMRSARRGMGMGILLALLTFFGYYVLMGLGLAMGKDRALYAWVHSTFSAGAPAILSLIAFLAGWLPDLTFLIIALILLRRSR